MKKLLIFLFALTLLSSSAFALDNIQAWWEFEDNLSDSVGAYDLTAYAFTPTYATGSVGEAVVFDGTEDSYLSSGDVYLTDTTWSINVWANFDVQSDKIFLTQYTANAVGRLLFRYKWDGTYFDFEGTSGGTTAFKCDSPSGPIPNLITSGDHLTTFTQNGSILKTYIDAVEVSSCTTGDTPLSVTSMIGGDDGYYQMEGSISQMIITTDAISVSEIEEIYNDGDGLLTYAEENPDSGYFEIASAPLSFNASVQDYCYQERPNATDSADGVNCNLDYTGSEFASRLTDGANAYDGNYSTFASYSSFPARIESIYNKPSNYVHNASIYQIKYKIGRFSAPILATINATIPDVCANFSDAIEIEARVYKGVSNSSITILCTLVTGGQVIIFNDSDSGGAGHYGEIYESGLIWDVQRDFSTTNGTITTDIENSGDRLRDLVLSVDDYFNITFADVNISSNYNATSQITIGAIDNETTSAINTFNVLITSTNGTYIANYSTTGGEVVFNTTIGAEQNLYFDAPGYAYANETITTNSSAYGYNITLQPENTIDFYIYDQIAGSLITENVSIILTGADYYSYTTTSGYYRAKNLTAGDYNISFNNENYSINTYALTLSPRSYMTLNAYLIESEYNSVFTFKDIDTGEILSGVTFAVSRDILGVPTLIQTLSSDITGRIKLYYTPDVEYSFVASLSDYENKGFGLNPVIFANYNVWLTADATGSDDVSDYAGVNVEISPSVYYNDLNNTIEVLFYAPDGNLQAYNFTATYKTTSVSDTGLNAYGDLLYSILEIKNASITDRVKLSYSYQLSTGSWKTYTDYYLIQNGDEATGTHGANIGETYGMTLLERVLILMFIIGLVAGILYLVAGIEASGVISFALLGYFAYIGFVTPWIIIPSMIFLFISIAWRVAT